MTDDAVPAEAGTLEDGATLAGVPDAFQRLWTPHRMAYIAGESKPIDATSGNCPFCTAPGRQDADGLVVHRGEHVYAVMNLYPYSPGHLLLCPYRHISDFTELTKPEAAELAAFTAQAMTVLRMVSHPTGFNLGINQGQVAGAGITAHLHQHVVPRWLGDANFLPVVAQTKALPMLLEDSRQQLAAAWAAL
ncbi:HIT domain-containing protein [Propionicimonas sp.]|uniref:HIT family protein n=1 Tax=Propionicimonas sp. TaxID=1955623 RepID=UPI00179CB2DC|nr:HIT domain-containing protein [Propionicimonas sp.]MBU3977292.1 HIT domain-containing protein [Actinomycetota bacterium]MBA3021217.1 HIT domain-containing protein [Propionicimonas sp.]MBU3985802.1 HIT domain-containing protein [Actinomycetota bacterium]MBU4008587.1 HIT domain-containing protein [Actinomycetota bacterium]MBU4066263.1 HIT domain-containing protein [Actinomycetota bacterium]